MRRLSNDEFLLMLDCDDWRGKAGGYAIQGKAAQYIKKISGSYSNISWFGFIYYVQTFTRSWVLIWIVKNGD